MIPLKRAFQPRPYDPDRVESQSDAQRSATARNFGIFRLRGLWSQAGMLGEPYRSAVRALIDADLERRGALPQRDHEMEAIRKRRAAQERKFKASICSECERSMLECECIPF